MGSTYDEALQNQQVEQPVETTIEEQSVDEPLTYDNRVDSYSHQLGYWMTRTVKDSNDNFVRVSRKYDGAEDLANNEELADITGKADFYEQMSKTASFEKRKFFSTRTGKNEDAIYMIFEYNGKKYGAYVSTEYGLKNNREFARLPFEQQQKILSNLRSFRNKILSLLY